MKRRLEEAQELLRITDDDDPLIVQMKLLRFDLQQDKAGRHRFERGIKITVALVGVLAMITAVIGWNTWRLGCEHERDSRESTKEGIVAGNTAAMRALLRVADAEDDPRAEALITSTERDTRETLEVILPPIRCANPITGS